MKINCLLQSLKKKKLERYLNLDYVHCTSEKLRHWISVTNIINVVARAISYSTKSNEYVYEALVHLVASVLSLYSTACVFMSRRTSLQRETKKRNIILRTTLKIVCRNYATASIRRWNCISYNYTHMVGNGSKSRWTNEVVEGHQRTRSVFVFPSRSVERNENEPFDGSLFSVKTVRTATFIYIKLFRRTSMGKTRLFELQQQRTHFRDIFVVNSCWPSI